MLPRKAEVQKKTLSSMSASSLPASPAGFATTVQKVSDEDRTKAAELAHFALPPLDQSGEILQVAKVMARSLGDSKNWNSNSADWDSMVDAIRADVASINKQFQSQRQEAHDQREKMLATNYSNTMTESKLDELLVYYRSNEGRRYQAFMQEIQVDIMNAITDITGKGFSSGMVDLSDTSQLSAKEQSSFSMSAADKLRVLRLVTGKKSIILGIITDLILLPLRSFLSRRQYNWRLPDWCGSRM